MPSTAPRVAVDAFGADRSPEVEVSGALLAAAEGRRVILVGDEARLRAELARQGFSRSANLASTIAIQHASEVVTMDDHPGAVVRKKPDASMRVACDLVVRGQADAVISAGNSGAMMALALLVLRRLPGVDRPAIATIFPTLTGQAVLLDMGANVDCKPHQLAQFALMGATYARLVLGKPRPRLGLLANGAEESKGTEATREALGLLRAIQHEAPQGFELLGYVEGRDIFAGAADVIVCDGFVGNVVLKSCEGLADTIIRFLKAEVDKRWIYKLGAFLMKGAFVQLKRRIDYAETGGAPLLGVTGPALICHGGSTPVAIKNAIGVAASLVEHEVIARLGEELSLHAGALEAARHGPVASA